MQPAIPIRIKRPFASPKENPKWYWSIASKNTGQRTIATSMYNHNFFVMDGQPTGPEILTTFPFKIQTDSLGSEGLAEVRGKQIVYLRELQKGEHVYSKGLRGFGGSAKDYDIKIENRRTGAGVRITGDQPLSKIVFWASSTTSMS